MQSMVLYDPPLCCSTGVCGPEVDPALAQTAAFLEHCKKAGVAVERHNLAQSPMAFATNPQIKQLLDTEGVEALPVLLIDGSIAVKGRYPTKEERVAWLKQLKEDRTDAVSAA